METKTKKLTSTLFFVIFMVVFPAVVFAQAVPTLGTVSLTPPALDNSSKSATIHVADVTNANSAVAVIMPPDYTGDAPADPDATSFPKLDLTDKGSGAYEGTYTGFSCFGTYRVAVYAKDTVSGNVSLPEESSVAQSYYDDAYEDDDTFGDANLINVGGASQKRHNFYESMDADWIKFYAFAGLPYRVDAKNVGTKADVIIDLYDTNGTTLLDSGNIGSEGGDDWLTYNFSQNGVYYVKFKNCTEADDCEYGLDTGYDVSISVETAPEGDRVNCSFTVTDKHFNAMIQNATITAEHSAEEANKCGTILSNQEYSMELIVRSATPYTLTCTAPGYKTVTNSNFVVSGATTTAIEMELETDPQNVLPPEFSPAPGTYTSPQNVTITCGTSEAVIYYTTNGNEPDSNSDVYSSPISVSSDMTIKATAYKEGWNSGKNTGSYVIDDLKTYYQDSDNDGYGNPDVTQQASSQPAGYVTNNTDCDDASGLINPGAEEQANGTDDNCNGQIDEGVTQATYYEDSDNDGYGNPSQSTQAAIKPPGYVLNNTDCNDGNGSIHPGAGEFCNGTDDNCNGQTDECCVAYYQDADSDGYGNPSQTMQACSKPSGYVSNNTDCNDGDSSVNPDAAESCNGKDDNCNGQTDECCITYYQDADGDGFGNPDISKQACSKPAGYVTDNTDPDDTDSSIYSGAAEICNGIDDNGDGQTDECCVTYYQDADGDGFGSPNKSEQACSQPAGYVTDNTDCNDSDNLVNPGAVEACNGKDDNCKDGTDECCVTYYQDADGDGFGDPDQNTAACSQPDGYVTNSSDCDDSDMLVYPDAGEICNGIDDNCDGQTDECCVTYYEDADGDEYGNPDQSTQACSQPDDYVTDNTDCDDSDASINPDADEVCNAKDDNCNGSTDDEVSVCNVADPYEEKGGDDTLQTAKPINLNETQNHTLHDSTDEDWVKFHVAIPAGYTFTARGNGGWKPITELYDADGNRIYPNNDRKDGSDDYSFERIFTQAGDYYVRVQNPSSEPPNKGYSIKVSSNFLERAVRGLKILTGMKDGCADDECPDADGDGKITMKDVLRYLLEV